jgi:hypothetical protein
MTKNTLKDYLQYARINFEEMSDSLGDDFDSSFVELLDVNVEVIFFVHHNLLRLPMFSRLGTDCMLQVSYVTAFGMLAHSYSNEISGRSWIDTQINNAPKRSISGILTSKSFTSTAPAPSVKHALSGDFSGKSPPISESDLAVEVPQVQYSPEDVLFFQIEWLCSAINDAERLCTPVMICYGTSLQGNQTKTKDKSALMSNKRVQVALAETCSAFKHVIRRGTDALCCALFKYICVCDDYILKQPMLLKSVTSAQTPTAGGKSLANVRPKGKTTPTPDDSELEADKPWINLFAHLQEFFKYVLGPSALASNLNPVCMNTLLLAISNKIVGWYLLQLNMLIKASRTLTPAQLDQLDLDIANVRCVIVGAINMDADHIVSDYETLHPDKAGAKSTKSDKSGVSDARAAPFLRYSHVCSQIFGVLDVVCALVNCSTGDDSSQQHAVGIFKKYALGNNMHDMIEWCHLCDWCLHLRGDFPKEKRKTLASFFKLSSTDLSSINKFYKLVSDAKEAMLTMYDNQQPQVVVGAAKKQNKPRKTPVRLALGVLEIDPTQAHIEKYLTERIAYVSTEKYHDEHDHEARRHRHGLGVLPTRWKATKPREGKEDDDEEEDDGSEVLSDLVEDSRAMRAFSLLASPNEYTSSPYDASKMKVVVSNVAMYHLPAMGSLANQYHFVLEVRDIVKESSVVSSLYPQWPQDEFVFDDLPANSTAVDLCLITVYFKG